MIILRYTLILKDGNRMKKIVIFLCVFFITVFHVFAQYIIQAEEIFKMSCDTKFYEYNQSFEIGKLGESYVVWNFNHGIKLSEDSLYCDDEKYSRFIYNDDKYIVLYGSNFFFIFEPKLWQTIKCYRPADIKKYYEDNSTQSNVFYDGNYLPKYGISNIKSSSFYSEQTKNGIIQYVSSYLNIILNEYIDIATFILRNPWVPGKDKNSSGIGEYLEIDFEKPKDNLVVLNGYVDLEKRYLYKANNRVKKATITSLDKNTPFTIEYEFEDYVHFSEINFPCAVSKVRFTIDEVYRGEKWDDTCIQAVITRWE